MELKPADELILGRYRPLGQVGEGGYGTVQLAFDPRIQRRVAVKCLPLEEPLASDGGASVPLAGGAYDASVPGLEEARTAALLQDPAIVGVLDFEARGSTAYLIMEYVDGASLSGLLDEFPAAIDADVTAAVVSAVAHALSFAHENGVLHLDVKPDNILINRQGQVKVSDFGLSKLSRAGGFGQATGGTIGYMPPEQMALETLDGRCDEWALASVVYEMIAGRNPFFARDLDEAQAVIANAELVLPSLCLDGLDPEADDVIFYALDPDRSQRYETVADFAEELLPFLGDAQAGRAKLAALVNDACEDEDERPERLLPALPLLDRLGERARSGVRRVVCAAACAMLGAAALLAIPAVGGVGALPFWGLLALLVCAAALLPGIGVLLAVGAFAVALIANGALLSGVVIALLAVLWWAVCGRLAPNAPPAAGVPVLLGAVGLGAVAPFVCGWALRVRDAAATAVFCWVLAAALAACGSGSVDGWWPFVHAAHIGPGYERSLALVLASPVAWLSLVAWLVAAVLGALLADRGSRGLAFAGAGLAAAALVAAFVARATLFGMPDGVQIALFAVSVGVGLALPALGVPWRD